jgi:hypothetical protein
MASMAMFNNQRVPLKSHKITIIITIKSHEITIFLGQITMLLIGQSHRNPIDFESYHARFKSQKSQKSQKKQHIPKIQKISKIPKIQKNQKIKKKTKNSKNPKNHIEITIEIP